MYLEPRQRQTWRRRFLLRLPDSQLRQVAAGPAGDPALEGQPAARNRYSVAPEPAVQQQRCVLRAHPRPGPTPLAPAALPSASEGAETAPRSPWSTRISTA